MAGWREMIGIAGWVVSVLGGGGCNATRNPSENKRKAKCNSIFIEGLRVALHPSPLLSPIHFPHVFVHFCIILWMACFNVRFRYGLAMLTLKVMFYVALVS